MGELELKVRDNWLKKIAHGKKIHQHAIEVQSRTHSQRIEPWVKQSVKQSTKQPDIKVENSRVKVMNVTFSKQYVD